MHGDAPVGQLIQLGKFLQEPYTPVTSYQQYLLQNLTTLKRKVMLRHDKLLFQQKATGYSSLCRCQWKEAVARTMHWIEAGRAPLVPL